MEKVGRNLLRDAAYERLRAAIVDGTLEPGLILRGDDIAERLGLSRAPIRDALSRLTTEGLVESKPQSFTRVTPLVEKDVRDAAAVVGAMHDLALRSVALSAEQLDRMRAAGERFAAAVRAGDLDAALEADDALHAVPVLACGNAAAAMTIERFTPLIRRAERLLWASPHGERSIRQHDELIAALSEPDTTRALAVNRTIWGHIHQGDDRAAD
ncbi:GntR family transcriptional regulator [Paractinoplanes atraurantiacus]|uniref:DNA-binding transcriptional regulator, GntR family n=1 Tax=Paractinoplanes atraurantiacus TaxID=1036182 RepID=A0A285IZU7_9ACTN|nr:GntR family transcriptional regulator [Actinoplanes atraurantiacus]SNY53502.1 DNA-binding transcriptional regulator, GntR family [Actinoplanes atraurantiacus]